MGVPKGTRFPTPPDLWKRQVVPTCALGEPETIFKLLICEVSPPQSETLRRVVEGTPGLRYIAAYRDDTERERGFLAARHSSAS